MAQKAAASPGKAGTAWLYAGKVKQQVAVTEPVYRDVGFKFLHHLDGAGVMTPATRNALRRFQARRISVTSWSCCRSTALASDVALPEPSTWVAKRSNFSRSRRFRHASW